MLWRTSPAATELEECVLDWLREMLGLPADFKGVIADCASTASLLAITAARDAMAPEIRARGMAGCGGMPKLRLYTSEQAHSSIEKGAMILGIGQENVRKIETDARFRMIRAPWSRRYATISRMAGGHSAWWQRWERHQRPALIQSRR